MAGQNTSCMSYRISAAMGVVHAMFSREIRFSWSCRRMVAVASWHCGLSVNRSPAQQWGGACTVYTKQSMREVRTFIQMCIYPHAYVRKIFSTCIVMTINASNRPFSTFRCSIWAQDTVNRFDYQTARWWRSSSLRCRTSDTWVLGQGMWACLRMPQMQS